MLIPIRHRNSPCRRFPFAAMLLFAVLAPAVAQESPKRLSLTQNRINEFAAAALTAETAFSGVKGAPNPGETPAQYALRVEGCIAALERLATQVEPLRTPPAVKDASPDNMARWQKIGRAVRGIPSAARDLRTAWSARQKSGAAHAFGPKLMEGLATVQAVLNGLRDARP
jgi:hypothetical protein